MIVGEARETLSSSNRSVGFGAEMNSTFFRTVSDSLYQHKVAACIRETVSNAVDSHISAGKPETPIKVSFPNHFDPNFTIEDFGIGLDDRGVEKIMFTYFGSDKRQDNTTIGGYGLGSKSPFSVSDTFTLRARKDGMEYVYFASIASDVPELIPTSTRPTDEPNGVQIKIPAREKDYRRFQDEAAFLLSFFDIPFEIEGIDYEFQYHVDNVQDQLNEKGYVTFPKFSRSSLYTDSSYYVLMGGVCYPIPGYIIDRCDPLISFLAPSREAIAFPFAIGSLRPAPSREHLSLDEDTETFLVEELNKFVDGFKQETIEEIDEATSVYEAISMVMKRYPDFPYPVQRSFTYAGISLLQWARKEIEIPLAGMRMFKPDWHGGAIVCRKMRGVQSCNSIAGQAHHMKPNKAFNAFYLEEDDPRTGFMAKVKSLVRDEDLEEDLGDLERPFFVFVEPISASQRNRISKLYADTINWIPWKRIKHLFTKKATSKSTHDRGVRTDETVYARSFSTKSGFVPAKNIPMDGSIELFFAIDEVDYVLHRRMEKYLGREVTIIFKNANNHRKIIEAGIKPVTEFYAERSDECFEKMVVRYLENRTNSGMSVPLSEGIGELMTYSDRAKAKIKKSLLPIRAIAKKYVDFSDKDSVTAFQDLPVIDSPEVREHPLVAEYNSILSDIRDEYKLYFDTRSSHFMRSHLEEIVKLIDFRFDVLSNGYSVDTDVESEPTEEAA